MDGSISPDEIAIMLSELKKLGYSHDLALNSIQYSKGDISAAVKYCYSKHNNNNNDYQDVNEGTTPHSEELQQIIQAIKNERAMSTNDAAGNSNGVINNDMLHVAEGDDDHPDHPPPIPSSASKTPQTIPSRTDSNMDTPSPSNNGSSAMLNVLTPKTEINRKYESEIEVLLSRQQSLSKELQDLEMEHTRILNQHSGELEKAEKQGRRSGQEEITQLKTEIASLAEKIVNNEKEYNDNITLLVESSSKQVFSLQEDLSKCQNLLNKAEADRDEARARETYTVERNKQLYAQISRSSSGDAIGNNNPHVMIGGPRRSVSANSSSSPPGSPSDNRRDSASNHHDINNSHQYRYDDDDERDKREVVHAMDNIISNVIWFEGVENAYQNHCDAMVAAEAQKKEELERLLVAQKSIVVSSRERINVLEGTVDEKMLEISELSKQVSLMPAIEAELSGSKRQMIELNNKLDGMQEGLSLKETDIASLEKEVDRLNRDKNRLNNDIDEKLSELHATQLMLESNKQQSTLAQAQASQALKELTSSRERESDISKENMLMKTEIENLKAQATVTSASLEALQKQKEQYASQVDAVSEIEIGHSNEMLKLRNKISELTSLTSAHSKELSNVEESYERKLKEQSDDHCKAIGKLDDEHHEKEKAFTNEKNRLEGSVKELKEIIAEKESRLADLKQQHTKELEEAVGSNADTHSELQRTHSLELSKLRQKMTELNAQSAAHQQELISADEAYELKLNTIKSDFNNKIERNNRENENELSELREGLKKEISKLNKDKEELHIEIEELRATIKLKDVTSLGAQDDLEKEREQHAIEIDKLNKLHATEIKKLRDSLVAQESGSDELKESYEKQLVSLKERHEKEKIILEDSKNEIEVALDDTKASLRDSQAEIDCLQQEISSRNQKLADDNIKSLKDDYQQQIETINDDYQRQIKTMNDASALREEEHTKDLNIAVSNEKQIHVARMAELEAALAVAKSNIDAQIQQHTTQLRSTLEEDKQKALQNLKDDLTETVQNANEERDEFKQLFTKENKLRKLIHNKLMDLQGNIRVICRVRPVLEMEKRSGQDLIVTEFLSEEDLIIAKDSTCKIKFEFDQCFTPESSQVEVFKAVQPLCISVLDGFNICIFAYGQTGSGKTFTMDGNQGEQRGIIQRTVLELFEISRQNPAIAYTFKITMLEIYNETIRDLLLTKGDKSNGDTRLDIRHNERGSNVMGLTEVQVAVPDQVFEVLERGRCNRAVGGHDMNEHSSRSHSIFTIMCTTRNTIDDSGTFGKLNLIDLAGSERLSKTEATGDRLKEAQSINRSLSALGDVINALGNKKNTHIPYRNSKLTYLLQDSLGGNSKVMMVVAISPASYNVGETICSLNFASRCRLTELGKAAKQLIETGRGGEDDNSSFVSSSPAGSSSTTPPPGDRDAQSLMSARRELKKKSTLGAFSR